MNHTNQTLYTQTQTLLRSKAFPKQVEDKMFISAGSAALRAPLINGRHGTGMWIGFGLDLILIFSDLCVITRVAQVGPPVHPLVTLEAPHGGCLKVALRSHILSTY